MTALDAIGWIALVWLVATPVALLGILALCRAAARGDSQLGIDP